MEFLRVLAIVITLWVVGLSAAAAARSAVGGTPLGEFGVVSQRLP